MMAEIFGLKRTSRHTSNSRNIAKQRSCTQVIARNLSELQNTCTEDTNISHHWKTVDGDSAIQPDHEHYQPSRKKVRVGREFQQELLDDTPRYSLRRKYPTKVLRILPLVRYIRGKKAIRYKRYPSKVELTPILKILSNPCHLDTKVQEEISILNLPFQRLKVTKTHRVKDRLGQIPLDEIKRAAKIAQIYKIFHLLSSEFKKNGNQHSTEKDNKVAQERMSPKECPKNDEEAFEEEVCKVNCQVTDSGSEENGCCEKYDREQMQNMKVCLCSNEQHKVHRSHANIVQEPTDLPPVSTSSPVMDFPDIPIICKKWEMFQEFTSKGGELRAENTDVVLCVPKGAITQKLTVQIRGAISSDLHAAHTNLQLTQHEMIVSPIAEFDAGQNFVFQKPVQVRLPHFLPPSFSQDHVHVYMFSKATDGNISVEQLKLLRTSKAHESLDESDERCGTFYFTKTGEICILTSHFTGFVCTYCKTNIEPAHVHLSLFAVYRQQERKEVKVCLFLWDKRLHMKDFRKNVMTDQEREMKSIKKGKLMMVDSNMDLEVGARMILHENQRNNWIISNEDAPFYPEEQSEKLGDILCCCSNSIPVCIEWSLHDNPASDPLPYFKCSVQVGYVPVTKDKHKKMKFCDNFKVRMFQVYNLRPKIPPDTAAAVSKCTKKNGQQVNIHKAKNVVVTNSVANELIDSQSNGLEQPLRVLREITNTKKIA